ncbi:MAG: 2-methylfumaryl-CoA isomerase [Limnohabitans sp.]|nr:2-methylfumaryl-CoA isomerase [Limnohabitans sp.]
MNTTAQLLGGMRVIEAAAFVAAPLGGMTLAQMGADVIRLDTVGGGLDYRRWPVTEDNTSLFWCGLNKHKRSVVVNLGTPEGRELAQALITAPGPEAGMLLTNFPPRGWLSYEDLSAKRPDLIQLTLMGDRQGGSAVDYTVNTRVGFPLLTGPENSEEVVNHVLPAWDLVTGKMAALGLLAAERHRLRTGQGQHVKLALEDMALATMAHLGFIAESQLGQQRQRYGNYLFGAFGRDVKTADGERLMVVGLTGKQWQALVDAVGLQAEVQRIEQQHDLNLRLEGDRFKAREAIAAAVQSWVGARTLDQVNQVFEQHGVCWGRYQSVEQMIANTLPGNPMFSTVTQPGVGQLSSPSLALDFSALAREPARPAPVLGQHTEQVMQEILGLSTAAYGQLHDRGIVAGPAR